MYFIFHPNLQCTSFVGSSGATCSQSIYIKIEELILSCGFSCCDFSWSDWCCIFEEHLWAVLFFSWYCCARRSPLSRHHKALSVSVILWGRGTAHKTEEVSLTSTLISEMINLWKSERGITLVQGFADFVLIWRAVLKKDAIQWFLLQSPEDYCYYCLIGPNRSRKILRRHYTWFDFKKHIT